MFLLRITIIIGLIMLAIPFFNKAKDYIGDKMGQAKEVGKKTEKNLEFWKEKRK